MIIRFDYDREKAQQVILWLAQRHGGGLDKLKLVKLVFFADREHLRRYGRPIVGGRYVAMDYGPVSSRLLDDINNSSGPFELSGIHVVPTKTLQEDLFSESDLEVLEATYVQYGHVQSARLTKITHRLRAWKDNHQQGTSSALPYEDFFKDFDDPEMLEIIREDQEARELLIP